MIIHGAEVWAWLAAAFLAGCFAGTFLFRFVARSRLAGAQFAVAAFLARIGSLRRRAQAPVWSEPRPVGRSAPAAVAANQDPQVWQIVERAVARSDDAEPTEHEPALQREFAVPEDDEYLPQPVDLDQPQIEDETDQGVEAPLEYDDPEPDPGIEPDAEDGWPERTEPGPLLSPVPQPPPRRVPILPLRPVAPVPRSRGVPRLSDPGPPPLLTAPLADEPGDNGLEIRRPATLAEPRSGIPDNLQRIKGIGERNEVRLNALGIFHFSQIAAWTPAELRWIGEQLAFPERIERDDWIGQAIVLASGGETGFTKSAERRRARRRNGRRGDDPDEESLD